MRVVRDDADGLVAWLAPAPRYCGRCWPRARAASVPMAERFDVDRHGRANRLDTGTAKGSSRWRRPVCHGRCGSSGATSGFRGWYVNLESVHERVDHAGHDPGPRPRSRRRHPTGRCSARTRTSSASAVASGRFTAQRRRRLSSGTRRPSKTSYAGGGRRSVTAGRTGGRTRRGRRRSCRPVVAWRTAADLRAERVSTSPWTGRRTRRRTGCRSVVDVGQAPLDLGRGVVAPVAAVRAHLRAGQRLRDAVGTRGRVGRVHVPAGLPAPTTSSGRRTGRRPSRSARPSCARAIAARVAVDDTVRDADRAARSRCARA